MVIGLATNNKKASHSLAELVAAYASSLAGQGQMAMAWGESTGPKFYSRGVEHGSTTLAVC